MKVVIVWGGWSCHAGYMRWAYAAEAIPPNERNKGESVDGIDAYEMSRIGKELFKPNPSLEDDPIVKIRKWIKDNKHILIKEVRMRTA